MSGSLVIPPNPGVAVVVAPHPDDETIGAGGLLFDLRQRGWETRVVVVSDGSQSHPAVVDLTARRERECRRACGHLLVTDVRFLGFPDASLPEHVPDIAEVLGTILADADVVVTPRHDDGHDDHLACAEAVDRVTRRLVTTPRTNSPSHRIGPGHRWQYGVWAWERVDATLLRTSDARRHCVSAAGRRAKASAMKEYESQCTGLLGDVVVPPSLLGIAALPYEVFW